MQADTHVTDDEVARFESRVMSVGHGVLSDSEWRRLIDTLHDVTRQRDVYHTALQTIAREDYRGNRPWSATHAWQTLRQFDDQARQSTQHCRECERLTRIVDLFAVAALDHACSLEGWSEDCTECQASKALCEHYKVGRTDT